MKTTQPSQRDPRKEASPGFLRVLGSFAIALIAIVGVGLGITYLSGPDEEPAASVEAARGDTSSPGSRAGDVASVEPASASSDRRTVHSVSNDDGAAPIQASAIEEASSEGQDSRAESQQGEGVSSRTVGENAAAALDAPDTENENLLPDATAGANLPEPVTFDEAEARYHDGAYVVAAEMFASYANANPENPWGHYMLGLSLWKSGDAETAETAFLEALDRNPDHVKALVNLARVRLELDRPEDARIPIERAVSLDGTSIAAHRVHARVLHSTGQREDALLAYEETLRLDPGDAWAHNNYGLILIESGRFGEAIPPLARAVEIEDEARFHNNLGAALESAGYFGAAADAYANALAADSTYAKAELSRDRVQPLIVGQSLPDPDLAELARQFQDALLAAGETEPTGDAPLETSLPPRAPHPATPAPKNGDTSSVIDPDADDEEVLEPVARVHD